MQIEFKVCVTFEQLVICF